MKDRWLFCVATSLTLALAGSACSSNRGEGAANAKSGEMVKVSGCLTSNENGHVVLTAAPDQAVATAERAGNSVRDTHTYLLTGGDNLQSHIGKRVEVTGTLARKSDEVKHETKQATETPARDAREDTARVTSTEQIEVDVNQLNVSSVREVAPTCQLNP